MCCSHVKPFTTVFYQTGWGFQVGSGHRAAAGAVNGSLITSLSWTAEMVITWPRQQRTKGGSLNMGWTKNPLLLRHEVIQGVLYCWCHPSSLKSTRNSVSLWQFWTYKGLKSSVLFINLLLETLFFILDCMSVDEFHIISFSADLLQRAQIVFSF